MQFRISSSISLQASQLFSQSASMPTSSSQFADLLLRHGRRDLLHDRGDFLRCLLTFRMAASSWPTKLTAPAAFNYFVAPCGSTLVISTCSTRCSATASPTAPFLVRDRNLEYDMCSQLPRRAQMPPCGFSVLRSRVFIPPLTKVSVQSNSLSLSL